MKIQPVQRAVTLGQYIIENNGFYPVAITTIIDFIEMEIEE